jgi:hypothetical protein
MGARRWRDYATAGGRRPVREFLEALDPEDAAAVAVALKEVEERGLQVTRHLRGPEERGLQRRRTLIARAKQ